jgi:hypothetical protein
MKLIYSLLIIALFGIITPTETKAQSRASLPDNVFVFKPQLGPNPATSFIKVAWQQQQGGNVMMQLWRLDGSLLATLVNQNYVAGNNSRSINLSGMPRGTYSFKLTIPGKSWSTTLIIE